MRFDLTDLRLFLNVVQAGSITSGAGQTNLALASASTRIQAMEAELGISLLERGRRGVRATPAGQALFHHARLVLTQLEQMRGELGAYARGLKGHVRLLCNTAAMTEFLPEALSGYLAAYPNINIDLEERPSHEIGRAIAEGLADIGIASDAIDLAGLETLPFRADRLVVVLPRRHVLASRRQLSLGDVLGYDFVGLSSGSALQEHLGYHAVRAGQSLNVRVRLRGFEAICRMVERGVGLGIVPETAALRCQRSMAIRKVRLADAWAVRNLVICARRFDVLPAHMRELVDHLRDQDIDAKVNFASRRQGR